MQNANLKIEFRKTQTWLSQCKLDSKKRKFDSTKRKLDFVEPSLHQKNQVFVNACELRRTRYKTSKRNSFFVLQNALIFAAF